MPLRRPIAATAICMLLCLCAENIAIGDDPSAEAVEPTQIQRLTSDELRALLAPIALYPDALLGQILPASNFPLQIVDAYRFTQTSANVYDPPAGASWDNSVIALLHYPPVLKRLNDDLNWTERLGFAVAYQMPDVTAMIQQIRGEAQAAGNLVSDNRQQIVSRDNAIEIAPTDPQVIYVPTYDPYTYNYRNNGAYFSYGDGYPYGLWLGNTWDWRDHRLHMGSYWNDRYGWRNSYSSGYWQAPYRPLPSWYQHGYGRPAGPPVGHNPGSALLTRPSYGGYTSDGRVRGNNSGVNTPTLRSPNTFPNTGIRSEGHAQGLGYSSNLDVNRDSQRGASSRVPATRFEPPVQQHERAPARVETPRYTPPVQHVEPQHFSRPSYSSGVAPSSGRTTQMESSRGSTSRSYSAGQSGHR